MSEVVLISGGSGLVGRALSNRLMALGHEVRWLGRRKREEEGIKTFVWNIESGTIDHKALKACTCVVHLAGAGIADGRWTKKRKEVLRDSRIKSGRLLVEAIKSHGDKVHSFVGASAIGYYGFDSGGPAFKEGDPAVKSFLGDLGVDWEAISDDLPATIRKTTIRIGIVLALEGGALDEMTKTKKFGVLGVIAPGSQVYSWIHIQDLVRLFETCLSEKSYSGIYNAVSPFPVSLKELMKGIKKSSKSRALLLPVPAFALSLALGEMAQILTQGCTVSTEHLINQGFEFQYPKLELALNQIYSTT